MKVKALTGYAPVFPAKHLSEAQFRAYGNQLKGALEERLVVFDEGHGLNDLWAYHLLMENPHLRPSDRHPAPDRFETPLHMVYSNIAILQRFKWLEIACRREPDVDAWVWLEYTICKQPGVTAAVIQQFMRDVAEHPFDAVSIPGCWLKAPIDDGAICWRFCGSTWVCPYQHVEKFATGAQTVAQLRTRCTGTISWDVNTLAFLELLNVVPIRWYPGDHNATQLTNYKVS